MSSSSASCPVESPQAIQTAKALTVVEVMVVALVLGVVAVVVLPLAGNNQALELERAARRITADILYVQTQALNRQTAQALIFDPGNGLYYYPDEDDPAQAATDPISKKDYRVVFEKAWSSSALMALPRMAEFPDIDLEFVKFTSAAGDEEEVIYFDELGFPTSQDGSALSSAFIRISNGRSSRTITVDTATGSPRSQSHGQP